MREWEAAKDQGSFRLQTALGRSYLWCKVHVSNWYPAGQMWPAKLKF